MVRISVGLWKRRQTGEEELPTAHDLSEPFFIPDIGSVRLFQFCLFDVPVLYLYQPNVTSMDLTLIFEVGNSKADFGIVS